MFSHVVIFWTDPAVSDAPDKVIAAGDRYLKGIPGITSYHFGRKVGSHRPVVDQTYQIALNIGFVNKAAQDAYQDHPEHLKFVAEAVKPFVKKVVVYDFE